MFACNVIHYYSYSKINEKTEYYRIERVTAEYVRTLPSANNDNNIRDMARLTVIAGISVHVRGLFVRIAREFRFLEKKRENGTRLLYYLQCDHENNKATHERVNLPRLNSSSPKSKLITENSNT